MIARLVNSAWVSFVFFELLLFHLLLPIDEGRSFFCQKSHAISATDPARLVGHDPHLMGPRPPPPPFQQLGRDPQRTGSWPTRRDGRNPQGSRPRKAVAGGSRPKTNRPTAVLGEWRNENKNGNFVFLVIFFLRLDAWKIKRNKNNKSVPFTTGPCTESRFDEFGCVGWVSFYSKIQCF